jgi:hypothetical protein
MGNVKMGQRSSWGDRTTLFTFSGAVLALGFGTGFAVVRLARVRPRPRLRRVERCILSKYAVEGFEL